VNVERVAAVGKAPRPTATWRRYWYPLAALVRRDVKKRYAASALGAVWVVLQPLVLLALYVFVFAFILRSGRDAQSSRGFVLYLLAGMLPYLALTEGVQRAAWALREDRSLLERESFPAEIIPAARVVTASVGEVVGFVLLIGFAAAAGRPLTAWLVLLPVLIALRIVMTLGLAWIVSTLAVFVADLSEVLSLLLTAWLFLTPIFYDAASAPGLLRGALVVNPLYHLVRAYRLIVIDGRSPGADVLAVLLSAGIFAGAGLWFFRKTLDRAKDLL
jgi:ABC-type polysaccharide/polyol phosphate export permease